MLLWMCVGEIDVCVYESVHSLANERNQKMCVFVCITTTELNPFLWMCKSECV